MITPVLEAIQEALNDKSKQKVIMNGERVGVTSLRLRTFLQSLKCSSCGLDASFFAIERDLAAAERGTPFHLNLYGIDQDGKEMLFTHDHSLARALGGSNNLTNTTTMCNYCNQAKAVGELIKVNEHRSST